MWDRFPQRREWSDTFTANSNRPCGCSGFRRAKREVVHRNPIWFSIRGSRSDIRRTSCAGQIPTNCGRVLIRRMASLKVGRRRISTFNDALEYFRSAALRKEAVFISYAGADQDAARDLIDGFRRRFQQVFDYRDGKSIRPGQPWIKEIFDQLAV